MDCLNVGCRQLRVARRLGRIGKKVLSNGLLEIVAAGSLRVARKFSCNYCCKQMGWARKFGRIETNNLSEGSLDIDGCWQLKGARRFGRIGMNFLAKARSGWWAVNSWVHANWEELGRRS